MWQQVYPAFHSLLVCSDVVLICRGMHTCTVLHQRIKQAMLDWLCQQGMSANNASMPNLQTPVVDTLSFLPYAKHWLLVAVVLSSNIIEVPSCAVATPPHPILCRWQRAEKFGLNPPQQVRSLLQQLQGEQWDKNIWDGRV